MEKKCTKCQKLKSLDCFFEKKTENRLSSWCKNCVYDHQKTRWLDRKNEAIKLFGGKCCVCGYNKNSAALEFHHLNPIEKEFDWNKLRLKRWNDVIHELKKCILVCSNCHREIHNPNSVLTDSVGNPSLQYLSCQISSTGKCVLCDTEVYGTKYCSRECAAKGTQRVQRPSKEDLEILIKNNNWCKIGRMFGVSDNAVRKWAKKYKLIE
jgi:hypothetical protein